MIFSTVSSFITHLLLIFATKMVNEIHNCTFRKNANPANYSQLQTKKYSQLQIKHEIMIFPAD